MPISRDQWWQELDGPYLELSCAETFLREAEGDAHLKQAERAEHAKRQIASLTRQISEQRARPYST